MPKNKITDEQVKLEFQDQETEENKIPLTPEETKRLLEQVEAEYTSSKNYLLHKKKVWGMRLSLFNNQKRDEDKFGDPLLYTIFMTVIASLYNDQMQVEFSGHETGDDTQAENLNHIARYDFDEMGMAEINYDWIFDSLFFGRGMVEFVGFNTKTNTPEVQVIDPLVFYRDPKASAFNDSSTSRGCRFWGQDVEVSKRELEKDRYASIDRIIQTSIKHDSGIEEARRARADAQNTQTDSKEGPEFGDNQTFQLVKWHTHFNGKKCLVVTTNDFADVVKYSVAKNQESWLAVDRPSSKMSRDWDGVSIPDLIEDKQRARAITQNATLDSIQHSIYPHYLYNETKITNPKELDFGLNKKTGIKHDPVGAVVALPKDYPNVNVVEYIMNQLDEAAQKATATPETQQGVTSSQDKTLGEINLVASKVGVRYSLTAKFFEISEKNFWKTWYFMYHKYMPDTSKKLVELKSAFGSDWKTYKKNELITPKADPNITITSKILSEAIRDKELTRLATVYKATAQNPGTNHRYIAKKMYKLIGYTITEINKLLPPSPDELMAEEENQLLDKNKKAPVKPNDDHMAHIEIHERAKATKATFAHIETHKAAMALQKAKPELFPELQNQQQMEPNVNAQLNPDAPSNISQALMMQ